MCPSFKPPKKDRLSRRRPTQREIDLQSTAKNFCLGPGVQLSYKAVANSTTRLRDQNDSQEVESFCELNGVSVELEIARRTSSFQISFSAIVARRQPRLAAVDWRASIRCKFARFLRDRCGLQPVFLPNRLGKTQLSCSRSTLKMAGRSYRMSLTFERRFFGRTVNQRLKR